MYCKVQAGGAHGLHQLLLMCDFFPPHRRDLPLIKQEIKQLEEEKGQLGSRVAAAIARVARLPDRGAYAELCTSLRRAHDEQVALSQHLQVRRSERRGCSGSELVP